MTTGEKTVVEGRERKLVADYEAVMRRILAGRVLVEAYRAEIATLLAGRALLPPAEAAVGKQKTDKLTADLQTLGFGSQEEFLKFNKKFCVLESKKSYRMTTGCDGCRNRVCTCYPDCIDRHMFFQSATRNILVLDATQISDFRRGLNVNTADDVEQIWQQHSGFIYWRNFPDHVSPGCPIRYTKVVEPRFDIYWGMPALTLEQYEKDKESWK